MVVYLDSVGLYMMWAGRHALPGCVKVISTVWKPLGSTLGHNGAWWKRDTDLTFITAGAFWRSLGSCVTWCIVSSLAIVCILDRHGLMDPGVAWALWRWFSKGGRHLLTKGTYLAIRLITYICRKSSHNQPVSAHTVLLEPWSNRYITMDNRHYFTGRYGEYQIVLP